MVALITIVTMRDNDDPGVKEKAGQSPFSMTVSGMRWSRVTPRRCTTGPRAPVVAELDDLPLGRHVWPDVEKNDNVFFSKI